MPGEPPVLAVARGAGSRAEAAPEVKVIAPPCMPVAQGVASRIRMIEHHKYCIDILTQIAAATRALQSVALGLLEEHLAHCVTATSRPSGPGR